jgi:hypothetical protein
MIQIDLQALDRQARSVAALGDDLQTSVARWRDALASPCAPSVCAVRDAYLKDFGVYTEVLRSWADAARTAAAGYDTVDDTVDDLVDDLVDRL